MKEDMDSSGRTETSNEQQEQELRDEYNRGKKKRMLKGQERCWKDKKEVVPNNKKNERTNTTSERKKRVLKGQEK